jgi:DNA-binding NarL/FixJ family response regulator
MQRANKTRVVIVDDHPIFRQGLRQVIDGNSRLETAGEAGGGEEAVQIILEQNPDVAVLDLNLAGPSGFEVIKELKARKCDVPIIVLTMVKEEQAFNKALNLGVRGYVLKENASAEILNCIAAVAKGDSYVCPALTNFMLHRRSRSAMLTEKRPGLEELTLAERRVLKRIAAGKTSREIATEFFISPRTVESHRSHICEKLELAGTNRLLQFALENRDALSDME